jgi:hypothetical protein
MTKTILATSAILIALCTAASARDAVLPQRMPPNAVTWSEAQRNAFGFVAPTEIVEPDAHQYHGGPKSND